MIYFYSFLEDNHNDMIKISNNLRQGHNNIILQPVSFSQVDFTQYVTVFLEQLLMHEDMLFFTHMFISFGKQLYYHK